MIMMQVSAHYHHSKYSLILSTFLAVFLQYAEVSTIKWRPIRSFCSVQKQCSRWRSGRLVTGESLVPKPLYVQYVPEMFFSNILNCCSTIAVRVQYCVMKPLSNPLPPDLHSHPNQNQYFFTLSVFKST